MVMLKVNDLVNIGNLVMSIQDLFLLFMKVVKMLLLEASEGTTYYRD